ncbi:MAG: GNAT family N-acetyltransferase [Ginsengibacter sp.]
MDQILKATTKDIGELNELINSAYRGDSAKEGWTNESEFLDGIRIDESELSKIIRNEKNTILKYVRKNKIVGCVLLEQQEDEIYLGMLTVKPILQATGIGKKLLTASEQFARSKKYYKIKMTVISIRTELIDWYKRFGYEDTLDRKPFISVDNKFGIPKQTLEFIVMTKTINSLSAANT